MKQARVYIAGVIHDKELFAMSLIVVCPHCLTWIEPQSECCPECAGAVDVDAPDPLESELSTQFGELLGGLGLVRLDRRGWPSIGRFVATTEGLMFIPDIFFRPNGAISLREKVSDENESWSERISQSSWWPWRAVVPVTDEPSQAEAEFAAMSITAQMLSSPGALFVARRSIKRIVPNWNRVRIDRSPSRSVSVTPVGRGASASRLYRRLRELPGWGTR